MNTFDRVSRGLARKLFWVSAAAIVVMMLLTCVDVVLRYFRRPLPGTYELVCFLGTVAVAFALAHTSVEKGHVSVSFVVQLFPRRLRGLIGCITSGFGFILFSLIAWRSMIYANELRLAGEVSLTLKLPFYPFVFGVGLSAAVVCLILASDLFKNVMKVLEK